MYIILIITLIIIITIVVITNIIIIVAIWSKLEGQSGVDSKLQGIRTLDSQPKFFLHLRAPDHGDDNDHNDDDHYDDDEDDGADHYNGDAHDARRELDRGMNMMIVHVMEVMMVIMVMMITMMVLEMMTVRIGG